MSKKPSQKTDKSAQFEMQKNAKKAEALLKILANAKRLIILCNLVDKQKSVSDLIALTKLSNSALSQHLKKMKEMDLVTDEKAGKEVFYSIKSNEIKAILSVLYLIYCK